MCVLPCHVYRNAPSYHTVCISNLNVPNTGNLIANWLVFCFRILANRQSAQRSRVRKLHYISELERSVTGLQVITSLLSHTNNEILQKDINGDNEIVLHTLNSECFSTYVCPNLCCEFPHHCSQSTQLVPNSVCLMNQLSLVFFKQSIHYYLRQLRNNK
jgi:hypothetical protein